MIQGLGLKENSSSSCFKTMVLAIKGSARIQCCVYWVHNLGDVALKPWDILGVVKTVVPFLGFPLY